MLIIVLLISFALFFYFVGLYLLSLEIKDEEIRIKIKQMIGGYFDMISDISLIIWIPIIAGIFSLVLIVRLLMQRRLQWFVSAFLRNGSARRKFLLLTGGFLLLVFIAILQQFRVYLITFLLAFIFLAAMEYKTIKTEIAERVRKRKT